MASPSPRPWVLFLLVLLLAFAIREHFVLVTIVDVPIRGDIREYVSYAWNLLQHGIYSRSFPADAVPASDAFRPPGYPWLLALAMQLFPQGTDWSQIRGWYPFVLQLQVVLGTATVGLAMATARRWLTPSWWLAAGLLAAIWPHHVAATGALMPEVLFGFTLCLAIYGFARGWETRGGHHRGLGWFALAGVAFGYAAMTNPVIALFPPCLAALIWAKRVRAGAVAMLVLSLLPVLGWSARAAQPDTGGPGRAAINLVQGSWADYHIAHALRASEHPRAVAVMAEIDSEIALLYRDPVAGGRHILRRLGADPVGAFRWYVIDKPLLLWDWDIRLGEGIYVVDVARSPLDTNPVLRACTSLLRLANPLLTLLALATSLGLLLHGRNDQRLPAMAVAALFAYLTLVHVVLQAEPRYAIAYRALEALLIATAGAWICGWLQRWWAGHGRTAAMEN